MTENILDTRDVYVRVATPFLDAMTNGLVDGILEDEVPCSTCTAPAVWEFSMRCCGAYVFTCEKHHNMLVAKLEGMVGRPSACGRCDHAFGCPASIDEFVRVVLV
jgi:hypothetical protein